MTKLQARVVRAIPDTWLDPLLTGPKAVIGMPPYDCRDIERLLTAIQDRVAALSAQRSRKKRRKS